MPDYQAIQTDVEQGLPVKEAIAKHGGSVGSYYSWRSHHGYSKKATNKPKQPKPAKPKVTTLELPGLNLGGQQLEIRGEPESLATFLVFLGRKLGGSQ